MKSLALAYLLLTFASSVTAGHKGHNDDQVHSAHGWGFLEDDFEPTKIDQLRTEAFFAPSEDHDGKRDRDLSMGAGCEDICKQCIEVITYFHRITSTYTLTHAQNDFAVEKQLYVLNDRYKDTPFYFKLESTTDIIFNAAWALDGLQFWTEIGEETRQGPLTTLNVYIVDAIGENADGDIYTGLGVPPRARSPLSIDGIMIRADMLPNGAPRSEGVKAVSAVGHWLGLLHTFRGESCSINNRGDFVNDTPQHLGPSVSNLVSCVEAASTCGNIDPVFNYMNYQNGDDCVPEYKGEFTCGQIERMYAQWFLFRDDTEVCSPGEFQFEVTVRLSELADPADPDNFFYLLTAEGDILFNSRTDLGLDTFVTDVTKDSFTFNICLPTRKYMFVVIDGPMDGMKDVAYRIFVDGVKVKENPGDFNSFAGYLVQPTPDPEYTHPGNAILATRPIFPNYVCPSGYSLLIATLDYSGPKGSSYFFVLNSEGESVFDPFFDNINQEAVPFDDTVAICLEDGDAYTAVHWYDSYASFSGQYKLFLDNHEIHSISGFDHEIVNGFLVETPQKTGAPPSPHPTAHPVPHPTAHPVPHPTAHPVPHPTSHPVPHPTSHPVPHPTAHPVPHPTAHPVPHPTSHPVPHPTAHPVPHPTAHPTSLVHLKQPIRTCSHGHPCKICEGDCDSDSECENHLVCFKKDKGVSGNNYVVPGCYGEDTSRTDWCVDPDSLR